MQSISLDGVWTLRGKPEQKNDPQILIDAEVPGCVQLDLSRHGYLPKDLYLGNNILQTERFEGYEWWYERSFSAPEKRDENVFLVFEGVDCFAEYFLNGIPFGCSENDLIAHEFDITTLLRDGENTLTVHLRSPLVAANAHDCDALRMINTDNDPVQCTVRKPAHSFGWDIMPRAVTSGLWRGVRLEMRDHAYFTQLFVRMPTKRYPATLFYEIRCPYDELSDLTVEAEGFCRDSCFSARQTLTHNKAGALPLAIKNPYLWMPYGYGEPNLYAARVRILKNGVPIHEQELTFGLRDVVLERTDVTDGVKGCFRFLVNGVEIFCKGSNWVPLDTFHCRDAARLDRALELAKEIGCNILRCWGGNVYEDHAFFDFCDRNGIMVWQDFGMACRAYPQNEEFRRLITDEVVSVVRKLRNHPSIILWSGDNEVDETVMKRGIDPTRNRITREWIPDVLHVNDPDRPYLPSSPYIGPEIFAERSTKKLPEAHLWGPRDYYKSDFYKNSTAHFVSETGYHGCPSLDSVKKFITPEKVWPYADNDEWILHSSDQKGNPHRVMLMEKQVRQLFGSVPTDPERYILASQISQAEADKYLIERMRVGRPHKSGVIWWNLLDGWPQMSDAVVDYYFCKKLAFGYIKRSQAPFTVAADEISSWNLRILACNDTLRAICGHLKITDALTDELLWEGDFHAKENASTPITSLPVWYSDKKILMMEWNADGEIGRNHYLCGNPPISLEDYDAFLEKYNWKE